MWVEARSRAQICISSAILPLSKDSSCSAPVVMSGDWNFDGDEDGRMRDGLGGPQDKDGIAHVFDVLFENFAEIRQLLPTVGRRGEDGLSVMSRLDRVHWNIAAAEALERYSGVVVVGSLHDERRPSDLLSLLVRVTPQRARVARLPRNWLRLAPSAGASGGSARGWSSVPTWATVVRRWMAQAAAKPARLALFSPTLSGPSLLAEVAMRVHVLAVPRIGRVWQEGACRPFEIMEFCRQWMEEAVLLRTSGARLACPLGVA